MPGSSNVNMLLDELLSTLEREGIAISPRDRLVVANLFLLQKDWQSSDLADALASLLARNSVDLKRLRLSLRSCLGQKEVTFAVVAEKVSVSTSGQPTKAKSYWKILRALTLFAVLGALLVAVFGPYPIDITMPIIFTSGQGTGATQPLIASDPTVWLLFAGSLVSIAACVWLALVWYQQRKPALSSEPESDLAIKVNRGLEWEATSPERFRPSEIGGKLEPWIGRAEYKALADVPNLTDDREFTCILDLKATVEASSRDARPNLKYETRRSVLRIFGLIDGAAAALAWNSLPREVLNSLSELGQEVTTSHFFGAISNALEDGRSEFYQLLVEEKVEHCWVLVISDGANIDINDEVLLERLASTRHCVWLDPREPRFWDEQTEYIESLGFSVFPATWEGVEAAIAALLAGGEKGRVYSPSVLRRRGLLLRRQLSLRANVGQTLGNAVSWAECCAMIQPVTASLASRIRLEFFTALPPQVIGRLFALPETRHTSTGLLFSDSVLAILREGFSKSLPETMQIRVLEFILSELRKVRPSQLEKRPGLALLAWAAIYERVKLELLPDEAALNLQSLMGTPLGPAIRANLAKLAKSWQERVPRTSEMIPLRLVPRTLEARKVLEGAETDLIQKVSKNIVILINGTCLSHLGARENSVSKFYSQLEFNAAKRKQVAFHIQPTTIFDSWNWGRFRQRRLRDIYCFLANCYAPGDRIYIVGAGRGAVVARAFCDLIFTCGLFCGHHLDGEELRSKASFALWAQWVAYKKGRTEFASSIREVKEGVSHGVVPIEFLGVWDSFAGAGFIFWLFKRGLIASVFGRIVSWFYEQAFPSGQYDLELKSNVRYAFQALAIDEEQAAFQPLVWDELTSLGTEVEQVWFAGSHANLSGQFPRTGLASVALHWMMVQARFCGLQFKNGALEDVFRDSNPNGRLADSLGGAAGLARRQVREVEKLTEGKLRGAVRIHDSVFERMRTRVTNYAPAFLPYKFEQVETLAYPSAVRQKSLEWRISLDLWRELVDRIATSNRRHVMVQAVIREYVILIALGFIVFGGFFRIDTGLALMSLENGKPLQHFLWVVLKYFAPAFLDEAVAYLILEVPWFLVALFMGLIILFFLSRYFYSRELAAREALVDCELDKASSEVGGLDRS